MLAQRYVIGRVGYVSYDLQYNTLLTGNAVPL